MQCTKIYLVFQIEGVTMSYLGPIQRPICTILNSERNDRTIGECKNCGGTLKLITSEITTCDEYYCLGCNNPVLWERTKSDLGLMG